MQIWAESGKSALPICNYSQILYQFLTFTQNLKRSLRLILSYLLLLPRHRHCRSNPETCHLISEFSIFISELLSII